MENIKFIKKLTDYCEGAFGNNFRRMVGDCVYYKFINCAYVFKMWCEESCVRVQVISPEYDIIDQVKVLFAYHFKSVQCEDDSQPFILHIVDGKWLYESDSRYGHVLPTDEDYKNLWDAIYVYMRMFF